MPKRDQPEPASPWDSGVRLLAWLSACVSIFSFLFYYRFGQVLLYGDAIAHINIARRVFDSKTPGLLQLGTVWLPLPHLLMIPFLVSDRMWQSGAGGSIPSMVGYVLGVIGIFRLVRSALARDSENDSAVRISAWAAAIAYAINPNLIYLQSTAMGESLYLAFFIWAVVYFTEWWRGEIRALVKCGLCLAAACLTRYDGWFLAAAMIVSAAVIASLRHRKGEVPPEKALVTPSSLLIFVLVTVTAPALWLAYNGIVYRNLLEFANGPYSARAIEKRSIAAGTLKHPGTDDLAIAELYFLKSGEANLAQGEWLQRLWIVLAVVAIAGAALLPSAGRVPLTLLFLFVPLVFYAISLAYGGVPIYVPYWWPFSHYNTRYGLQLLPASAVLVGVVAFLLMTSKRLSRRLRLAGGVALFGFVGASYSSIWNATPVTLREAQVNMRTRNQLQMQLARWIEQFPPQSTLLMYLGDHVGALERADFPLKRTINEGNHRVWMQPDDPEGLWERALANPPQYADFVLAFDGDPVWQAVHTLRLHEMAEIHVSGQPRAILYRARESGR